MDVSEELLLTGARQHRLFAGRLDRNLLGFAERAVVRALHVPVGDYRDWDEIGAWAGTIAQDLRTRLDDRPRVVPG